MYFQQKAHEEHLMQSLKISRMKDGGHPIFKKNAQQFKQLDALLRLIFFFRKECHKCTEKPVVRQIVTTRISNVRVFICHTAPFLSNKA